MAKRVITLQQACASYPHRYTMEHVPQWAAKRPIDSGGTETRYYAPQYATDKEWYDNTTFPGEGSIDRRARHCESNGQTWPLGQWLAQPYTR